MNRLILLLVIFHFIHPDIIRAQSGFKTAEKVRFPGGKPQFDIPFEFYGMNLMVKAKMNGLNVNLLIDNGVFWEEAWFFGNDQVDSLGFIYDEDILVEGAGEGEGIESKTANCPDICFGDLVIPDQRAIVSPKEQGFYGYFPGVAGQICGTLFSHFIVGFNFDSNLITLYDPGDFLYRGNGLFLDMRPDSSGSFSIPIRVVKGKKVIDLRLFIDLGGIYPLTLVVNDDFNVKKNTEKTVLGYGASGEIRGYRASLEEVQLGNYVMKDVPVVLVEDVTGGNHTDLTIGLPLLMKFNLVFDYFNRRLYFEPNRHFDGPFIMPDAGR